MKRRQGLYTAVTALFLILITGSNAVRADIPGWFWNTLFSWSGGVTAEVDALEAQVNALNAQVAAMDAYIQKLQAYVEVDETTDPARPTVRIFAANLQVVNGGAPSNTLSNGLGNIIVGYDAPRTSGLPVCSDGIWQDSSDCTAAGGVWALSHKSGSHNLIVGGSNSYSRIGGIVSGRNNVINGPYALAIGGSENAASGLLSSVIGGGFNKATGEKSSINGGSNNTASWSSSVVSGGALNTSSGANSVVSGGYGNIASGAYSVVSGGRLNVANFLESVVSGGQQNAASGTQSVVSGGIRNTTSARWATVSGGADRTSNGEADWRAGTLFENF